MAGYFLKIPTITDVLSVERMTDMLLLPTYLTGAEYDRFKCFKRIWIHVRYDGLCCISVFVSVAHPVYVPIDKETLDICVDLGNITPPVICCLYLYMFRSNILTEFRIW